MLRTFIPYGIKLQPDELKREWLKSSDIHVVEREDGFLRAGRLTIDTSRQQNLLLDGRPLYVPHIAFVFLYPAPQTPLEAEIEIQSGINQLHQHMDDWNAHESASRTLQGAGA